MSDEFAPQLVMIDSDVCVHAVCNQAERSNPEGEPLPHVLHSLKLQVAKWIDDAGGNCDDDRSFQLYLSGPTGTNWRYDVDPNYKGKRPPKPRYFKEARQYLKDYWNANQVEGEADDALARELWQDYQKAVDEAAYFGDDIKLCCTKVLVSVDKDLDMVPGWHFNPRKQELYYIDEPTGWKNFFRQMLTGDTVDNIKGLRSVGPVKAGKILDGGDGTPETTYLAVVEAYATTQAKGKFVADYTDIFQAADLLWMVRDGRRGHQVLLDLIPGHVTKYHFRKCRQEVIDATNKARLGESEGQTVPAVDPNPFD